MKQYIIEQGKAIITEEIQKIATKTEILNLRQQEQQMLFSLESQIDRMEQEKEKAILNIQLYNEILAALDAQQTE